jgi:hypothetical protein
LKPTPSPFIEDGFTVSGKVLERPGLFPEFTITYRPYDWMERDSSRRKLQEYREGTPEFYQKRAEMLTQRLVRWSLDRPITVDNIKKMKPYVFDILESFVIGVYGPDVLLEEKERGHIAQVNEDLKK